MTWIVTRSQRRYKVSPNTYLHRMWLQYGYARLKIRRAGHGGYNPTHLTKFSSSKIKEEGKREQQNSTIKADEERSRIINDTVEEGHRIRKSKAQIIEKAWSSRQ